MGSLHKKIFRSIGNAVSRRGPVILLSFSSILFGALFSGTVYLYSLYSGSPDIVMFNRIALQPLPGIFAPALCMLKIILIMAIPLPIMMNKNGAGSEYPDGTTDEKGFINQVLVPFLAAFLFAFVIIAETIPAFVLWNLWGGYVDFPVFAALYGIILFFSVIPASIALLVKTFIKKGSAAYPITLVLSGVVLYLLWVSGIETGFVQYESPGHPLVVPFFKQLYLVYIYCIGIPLLLFVQFLARKRKKADSKTGKRVKETGRWRGREKAVPVFRAGEDRQRTFVLISVWILVLAAVVIVNHTLPGDYRSPRIPPFSGFIPDLTFLKDGLFSRETTEQKELRGTALALDKNQETQGDFLYEGVDNAFLKRFFLKLKKLEKGKSDKVRVLHYGDSLIWGDCFSIVVKRRFQEDFGDGGRGIVPVIETLPTTLRDHENRTDASRFRYYRTCHEFRSADGFKMEPEVNPRLGFTGESAVPLTAGATVRYEKPAGLNEWERIQVYLRAPLYGSAGNEEYTVTVKTEQSSHEKEILLGPGGFGTADFETAPTGVLEIGVRDRGGELPYIDAVNLETERGVAYSTVVRMGTHLAWLKSIPRERLAAGLGKLNPDMIIFQYGVNEAASIRGYPEFSVDDFRRQLEEILRLFKEILPETDILLIGPPERMLVLDGNPVPFSETLEVREIQKETARAMSIAFFDTYGFLGGEGHMKNLVARGLAMDDYTHLTIPGGKLAADGFYDTLMGAYRGNQQARTLAPVKQAIEDEEVNRAIQFNSRAYAYFLILVLAAGLALLRFPQVRFAFLILASYYFYATWKIWPLALLVFSTVIDYTLAIMIHRAQKNGKKGTAFLVVSLASNLGLLFMFKYADFFSGMVNNLLEGYGVGAGIPLINTVLPVGISFYTFQTLSYTIDVWRGELGPERNFLKFALFVTFFPQLVAGPIVRAKQFLPALRDRARHFMVTHRHFSAGIFLIFTGLVKKMAADWLAVNIIDRVYANPGMFTSAETLAAVYAYGIQIYGDFSGYTDIAIGSAMLLGFNLVENFRRPYAAVSVSDFWRRWHISLGSWFRDYLYISLGGNRGRVHFNLLVTMVLCGLWHGAGTQFLLWGVFHGVLLVIEGALKINKGDEPGGFPRALRVFVTLHLVLFGWIIFRSDTWETFTGILNSLTEFSAGAPNIGSALVSVILFAYGYHFTPIAWRERLTNIWKEQPAIIQGIAAAVLTLVVYNLAVTGGRPFIYFQF